ncbi:MAG: diadenylate cyclase CdaA [Bacilli bacterium]|nr:diadenylate cyclase CdaA [Bacilli bacterium]
MFDNLIKIISDYTNDFSTLGILKLILDLSLVLALFFALYVLIKKRIKPGKVLVAILVFLVAYLITILFDLRMIRSIIEVIAFWMVGIFVIIYSQEIRNLWESVFVMSKVDNSFTSVQEKQGIINTIAQTVDYLSKRHIGALITFEREDSLNTFIEKAIQINSVITQEILTTIFTPGTACHDGAVIIRKNRIMCAGAYFPSTDKYDVPKSFGTRHRAAIGVSERYDALTIVVSEETGNVSITISGVINLELSNERIREILDQYLIIK